MKSSTFIQNPRYIMQDIDRISIPPHLTLQETLKIFGTIDGVRLLVVVDSNKSFLGIITDPDSRRGLTKGLSLQSPIESIIQKTPITAHINDSKQKLIGLSAKHNIYEIPILDDNGRVVKVESISSLLKPQNFSNTIVIMAGGLGKRLRPLTNTLPKPMLKVGQKPILQIILERLKIQGFSNIILCVHYKSHIIEEYFGNGEHLGLSIRYIKESKALGTAGALGLIDNIGVESFLVMNGDILTDLNLAAMFSFHKNKQATATMGVREFHYQVPYGVVESKDSQILSITEKPLLNYSVSAGIYILEPKVLPLIPKDTFFDMPDLFALLLNKQDCSAYSYPITDYWIDIGRHEEYERANSEYFD